MIQNEIFSMWHKYGEKLMDTQLDLLHRTTDQKNDKKNRKQLECGQMPNVMVALPNTGGALCSTPQSLADAHYWSAVQ